ncbi:MAG: zinc ABC transporter substrate-binding protein [Candidatus Moraniibacteriota bacterium]
MSKNTVITIIFVLGLLLISLAVFVLLRQTKPSSQILNSGKIQVVASLYPLSFFAQQIGGDKAHVTNIVPAGAEPHDYEPTAQDMATMENSQLIILNGSNLEGWGDTIKQNIDPGKTTIITVSDGLATQQVTENGQTGIDPHIWLAPPLAEKIVAKLVQGFEQADPANAVYYQTNADILKSKLNDLDRAYKQGLSNCKEKNIITSHMAFSYLATTYGLNQVAIAGLSPDAEPSPQQLAGIVQFAKANSVKYIFFESLASPKLAQTIATEIGAQTLVLNPLEGLSDTELAQGENYLTVMQNNLSNLQTALQCAK